MEHGELTLDATESFSIHVPQTAGRQRLCLSVFVWCQSDNEACVSFNFKGGETDDLVVEIAEGRYKILGPSAPAQGANDA